MKSCAVTSRATIGNESKSARFNFRFSFRFALAILRYVSAGPGSTTAAAPSVWLVPIAGPTLEPIELIDKPDGLTIGRHEQCDICLPADAEKVSRFHARFARRDGRWS